MDKTNNTIDILNQYSHYLADVKHYSQTTISGYIIDLKNFFKFIKEYYNLSINIEKFNIYILGGIKQEDITAFLVYLSEKNIQIVTKKRKLAAIKSFYNWLFGFYKIDKNENPVLDLPEMIDVYKLPKCLSFEEAKKIINIYNDSNCENYIRNNTIIFVFLNCGLRVSELTNINLNDLNLKDGYIKIIGKGNKERKCYLNSATKKKILEYLQIRNCSESQALFLSSRNTKMSRRTVEKIVEDAYELAGMGDRGYTTHTLRHSAATFIYKETHDLLIVKNFLGHSTILSTEIYTHVDNREVRNAVENNPLANYIVGGVE